VEGKIRKVSDGRLLSWTTQVSDDKSDTQTIELPHGPSLAASCAKLLDEHGCGGFMPLLRTLQARLEEPRVLTGLWKDRPVVVLRGRITPDHEAAARLPAELRSELQPRQANLYLDAETLWPHRVEWWGSAESGDPLVLLLQIEFRDPVLDRALSAEECRRIFACSESPETSSRTRAGQPVTDAPAR
jgi:hypothetical protein